MPGRNATGPMTPSSICGTCRVLESVTDLHELASNRPPAGAVEPLAVVFSDETIGTRTSGRTLRELADRPEPTEAAIVVSGGVGASRTDWFSRTNPDRPDRPERATAAVRRHRHPAAVQHCIGMDASSPHS